MQINEQDVSYEHVSALLLAVSQAKSGQFTTTVVGNLAIVEFTIPNTSTVVPTPSEYKIQLVSSYDEASGVYTFSVHGLSPENVHM